MILVMTLLSSCISVDLGGFGQRAPGPVLADAGPGAVTAVETTTEPVATAIPELDETVTPEPTILKITEPVATATPEPAVVTHQAAAVEKKKFGIFGWIGKRKSGKVKTASYVPYPDAEPEAVAKVEATTELVATVTPEPVATATPEAAVVTHQAAAVEKKKFGIFGWIGKRKSGKVKTASYVPYPDAEPEAVAKVEAKQHRRHVADL